MVVKNVQKILLRDLEILKTEISAYQNEQNLWKIDKNISNSAGNLCLHLVGNLKTYIGRCLGKIEYVRDRNAEFYMKNIPKIELLTKIETTISVVEKALENFPEEDLQNDFPFNENDHHEPFSIEFYLIHLTTHLKYHLGQINYHRRFFDQ